MIGLVLGLIYYMKYRWRREEDQSRQMYDMVARIIGTALVSYYHPSGCVVPPNTDDVTSSSSKRG